ncbi:helix-turn-helix transcriptional regulator [Nocardia takedensis]|uniref:helix-turn-helix transcriptional regulator n=1 Tax=Nocardia takedensis TaxID=259390 RepID=UPI0003058174|nr:helix-turn-helix domain-containing protein [Nocardia takedensis]
MTSQHTAGRIHSDRLTLPEAAEYLGFSRGTLYNFRHYGTGPRSYKIGNRLVYDRADLDLWIAQQKAATLVGA